MNANVNEVANSSHPFHLHSHPFLNRYANYHPEFYITLVYIYATCISVAANMFYFVDKYPLRSRIRFGYGMFFTSLIAFLISETAVEHGHMSRMWPVVSRFSFNV
jgi:hypothetical protein